MSILSRIMLRRANFFPSMKLSFFSFSYFSLVRVIRRRTWKVWKRPTTRIPTSVRSEIQYVNSLCSTDDDVWLQQKSKKIAKAIDERWTRCSVGVKPCRQSEKGEEGSRRPRGAWKSEFVFSQLVRIYLTQIVWNKYFPTAVLSFNSSAMLWLCRGFALDELISIPHKSRALLWYLFSYFQFSHNRLSSLMWCAVNNIWWMMERMHSNRWRNDTLIEWKSVNISHSFFSMMWQAAARWDFDNEFFSCKLLWDERVPHVGSMPWIISACSSASSSSSAAIERKLESLWTISMRFLCILGNLHNLTLHIVEHSWHS